MFFDDRLATVLRHRAAGENAARTQFRQLLDLLGNRKYGRDETLIAAAWLRLGALGELIPARERARMVAEPGWRFRSAELAAHLAEEEPEVAAAALARAELDEADWQTLIPQLPIRSRGFLRLRRDLPEGAKEILERLGVRDRGLPPPEARADMTQSGARTGALAETGTQAPAETGMVEPSEEDRQKEAEPITAAAHQTEDAGEKTPIAELVERIARFRKSRDKDSDARAPTRISLRQRAGKGDAGEAQICTGFAFITDRGGKIIFSDPQIAPMVVGKSLLEPLNLGLADDASAIARAFRRRVPMRSLALSIVGAEAISGEWQIDAAPRFSRPGGVFLGYAGRARRIVSGEPHSEARKREGERIRQMLHELRTPINAIQGFAEVIQQQVFGPAPNEYRALAANIAGDAARILAGFDELERLARLESGALAMSGGASDLCTPVKQMTAQLQQVLSPRMAGFKIVALGSEPCMVNLEEGEAQSLIWRVLATLAGACGAGEVLEIELVADGQMARLWCQLPLTIVAEENIFASQVSNEGGGLSSGLFGAGFSLRLARAEALGAHGDLIHEDDRLCLSLPLLTAQTGDSSAEKQRRL